MKIKKKNIVAGIVLILAAFVYYYINLPAINIHSKGFWGFLALLIVAVIALYCSKRVRTVDEFKESKFVKYGTWLLLLLGAAFLIGSLLSSTLINASKYQKLLTVEEGEFEKDIEELSFDQIPILDRESAQILGNRKMGSMVDLVSQFEVDDLYTQINFNNTPVRVTPLNYASVIKWFTNQKDGIPAYIKIDMATQTTELVKLEKGIMYSEAEYLNRNIHRHLRFKYPTYIFDEFSFEIDENGVPYWVCPVKDYKIGLFGGETIGKVVLCNAITGETEVYKLGDVPTWVDRVCSSDLMVRLYDYYGTLKHGYFNSVFSQKDCLQATNGYNYLAIDDDVWVYTGVTSVSGDQSNVGFVLMNQRTMETKFYPIEGAIEDSAMDSAEGQVQHLGYQATFPLLLNISDQPTYFIALKDDAGLVKKYAMVNVQKYQLVAIGDTVSDCEEEYQKLLVKNNVIQEESEEKQEKDIKKISGTITKIAQGVVDGNSHYYLMLDSSEELFDVSVVDYLDIIRYEVGDSVVLEYTKGENANIVMGIPEQKSEE